MQWSIEYFFPLILEKIYRNMGENLWGDKTNLDVVLTQNHYYVDSNSSSEAVIDESCPFFWGK